MTYLVRVIPWFDGEIIDAYVYQGADIVQYFTEEEGGPEAAQALADKLNKKENKDNG